MRGQRPENDDGRGATRQVSRPPAQRYPGGPCDLGGTSLQQLLTEWTRGDTCRTLAKCLDLLDRPRLQPERGGCCHQVVKCRADVGDCRLIACPVQQGVDRPQGHLCGEARFLSDKITGCPNESCRFDIGRGGALQRDVQEARTAGGGEPLARIPVVLDQVAENLPGVAAGIARNDILVDRQIGRAQAGMHPIAPVRLVRTPRGDEDTFAESVDAPIIVWRQATVPTRLGIGDRARRASPGAPGPRRQSDGSPTCDDGSAPGLP